MGEKFSVGQGDPEVNAFAEFFPEESEQNEALRYETVAELIDAFGDQQFQYGSHTGTVSAIVEVCPHIKAMLDRGVVASEIAAEVAPYATEEIQVEQPVDEPKAVEPEVVAAEAVDDSHATETVVDRSQSVESAPSKSEAADKSTDKSDVSSDTQIDTDTSPQQDQAESPSPADQSKSAEVDSGVDAPSNLTESSAGEVVAPSADASDSKSETESVADATSNKSVPEVVAAVEAISHDNVTDDSDGDAKPVVEKSVASIATDEKVQAEQAPVSVSISEKPAEVIVDDLEIESTKSIEVAAANIESVSLVENNVTVEKDEAESVLPQPEELIAPAETMSIDEVDSAETTIETITETNIPDLVFETETVESPDDLVESVQDLELELDTEIDETKIDLAVEEDQSVESVDIDTELEGSVVDMIDENLDHDYVQTEESFLEQDADYEQELPDELDAEFVDAEILPVDAELEADFDIESFELESMEPDEAQDEAFDETEIDAPEEDLENLRTLEFSSESDEPEHASELHDFIDSEHEEIELAPLPVAEISEEVTEVLDITLDQEAQYEPEVFYESIKKLERNIHVLKQATSAEECSDALEAIHASLVEILDALGCYDSEATAKYLLDHHTLSELHELLVRLQRELSEKNKLKPVTATATNVARTLGRYVVNSYRKVWAS